MKNKYGISISENMKDLITKLLDRDSLTRLGVQGLIEIISHPWFSDIDFDLLNKKQIVSPFMPKIIEAFQVDEEFKEDQSIKVDETILDDMAKRIVNKNQEKFDKFEEARYQIIKINQFITS